jgi:phosphoribosyl 1,2-cyclic phosphodiesterase
LEPAKQLTWTGQRRKIDLQLKASGTESMQVKFWGVRGSTPTPQAGNLRYGGNTSCVEVRFGNNLFVFDCGTGFRSLGQQLESESNGKPISAHIFVSHFHWDHIQGIPFFRPLYENSQNQFSFHSSRRTRSLQRVMEEQMASPYFPVNTSEMKAQRNFYDMEEGETKLPDATMRALWLNHPQGCMGFRLETRDGILVYATDNEPGDELFDRNVRKLAEGANVLIYDSQYLPGEYEARRRGWGHSHWREAINVVMESGAQELVLFHHDPDHDDSVIDGVVQEARNYYPRVRAAAEGMELQISR